MNISKFIIACVAGLLSASCGNYGNGDDSTITSIESGEAAEANIETAIMQGRTAARTFLNADASDTLALQGMLLDARALQSKYILAGQQENAAAFDTAFIHTLRAAAPEVARAVEAIPIEK